MKTLRYLCLIGVCFAFLAGCCNTDMSCANMSTVGCCSSCDYCTTSQNMWY